MNLKSSNFKIYLGGAYLIVLFLCIYFLFSNFSISDLTSYTFIKENKGLILQYKDNNIFFLALSRPGLWLQNITTKQPDDEQVEVALRALKEAFGDKLSQYSKGETYVAEAIG